MKQAVCTHLYVAVFPFYAVLISTKFCTDLPTNSGKVLNTSMTPSTQLPDPMVPQIPKPKQIMGEKILL